MTVFTLDPGDQELAIAEAIERTLHAQAYGQRGQRLQRADLRDMFSMLKQVQTMKNAAPGGMTLGCIVRPT